MLRGVPKRNAEGTPPRVLSSTVATCAPSERRGRGVPILLSMLSENEPPGAAWVLVLVLVATPLDLGEGVAVDVEEEDGSRKLSPGTGKCCSPGWAQSRLADRLGPPERPGIDGAPRSVVWSRSGWLRPCARTDTCPCWSGSESPPCIVRVCIREIARRLERNASTVSREVHRNTAPHDRGEYDAPLAHSRARARGTRPGRSRLATDLGLRAVVLEELEIEWSPEQIAAHLRMTFPDRPRWHLCHETIYQALYRGARGGLNRRLTKRLRTGRPLRKHRRRSDQRRTRCVIPHQRIEHLPAIVTERTQLRDWEGDLVVGPMSKSAVPPWVTVAPATFG